MTTAVFNRLIEIVDNTTDKVSSLMEEMVALEEYKKTKKEKELPKATKKALLTSPSEIDNYIQALYRKKPEFHVDITSNSDISERRRPSLQTVFSFNTPTSSEGSPFWKKPLNERQKSPSGDSDVVSCTSVDERLKSSRCNSHVSLIEPIDDKNKLAFQSDVVFSHENIRYEVQMRGIFDLLQSRGKMNLNGMDVDF